MLSLLQLQQILLLVIPVVTGQGRGAMRLIRNGYYSTVQAYTSGIVQIYITPYWGNICDDTSFGSDEANVICHQLAFTGASSYGNTGTNSLYGKDNFSTWLEDVSCSSSSYLALLQCSVAIRYSTYCNDHSRDVYVECYSTKIWSNPYLGQIRLIGSDYSNQGRMEVYCNNRWGTVCDDSFTSTSANVACRQLGYSGYSRYEYTSSLKGGNGQPIWVDQIMCRGSTSSCFSDCQRCPSQEIHNCDHSEDVTLECEFPSIYSSGIHTTLATCQYSNVNAGAIAGGVIGAIIVIVLAVVVAVIVAVVIIYFIKTKKSFRVPPAAAPSNEFPLQATAGYPSTQVQNNFAYYPPNTQPAVQQQPIHYKRVHP